MGLDDHNMVSYRPRLTAFVGSITSTLLLCQAMYWARRSEGPFYKFTQPCGHAQYRDGDSWCEELGFSRHEYLGAIGKIGQRLNSRTMPDPEAYIWYWTDMSRLTYFQVNWQRVNLLFEQAYPENPNCGDMKIRNADLRKSEKRTFINAESGDSNSEQRLTTETNQKTSASDADAAFSKEQIDLMDELRSMGLSIDKVRSSITEWPAVVIRQKIKDLAVDMAKGRVRNLSGYINKIFSGEIYAPAQVEQIVKRSEKRAVRQDVTPTDEPMDDSIPDYTDEQLKSWLADEIMPSTTMRQLWLSKRLDSTFMRCSLRHYVLNSNNKENQQWKNQER